MSWIIVCWGVYARVGCYAVDWNVGQFICLRLAVSKEAANDLFALF